MPSTLLPTTVDTEVPSWKSPNELIHERINFDDTIWGFGLAGGAYYKTPLRITYVRPGSRAEMAHIYPGDVVLKINGIDSSTLTLDVAHQMIVESGIHLKINVTSPEDLEDNYYCYQDPLEDPLLEEIKAKQVKHKGTPRFPKVLGKCSHWSLQWPWKCKRKIIYKESNCYLVPSKYEEKHKDTRKPEVKQDDMIVLDSIRNVKRKQEATEKKANKKVVNSEKDISNDNLDIKKENDVIENHGAGDENSTVNIKVDNSSVSETVEGIYTEHDNITDKNKKDDATEQISSVDKKDENIAIEQNGSVDINDKDVVLEQNSSVDKNDEDVVEEKNSSVEKNNEDVVADQNNSVQNSSVYKHDEDPLAEQDNFVDENAKDLVLEEDSSINKNNDDVVAEHIISVDESGENGVAQENSVDKNDEKDSSKASDLIDKNKPNVDNVIFENGDIPGISESEKLTHNSR